jgi:hypothetical protein
MTIHSNAGMPFLRGLARGVLDSLQMHVVHENWRLYFPLIMSSDVRQGTIALLGMFLELLPTRADQ